METAPHREAHPRRVSLSPADTVDEAARRALVFGLESMRANQAPAEAGESEPLHQLRVSCRRLRASLELFSGVLYASQVRQMRRDLPWISAQAGVVRECDVISTLLKDRARHIDPGLAGAVAPMLAVLEHHRVQEQARLCELLKSKRYLATLARLSRPSIKKVGAQRRLGLTAAQMLRSCARAAIRKGSLLADAAPADVFHKVRVRVKRLRYALEMFAPLGAKHHKRVLARLEELQEQLGLYNDAQVASAWLKQYAGTAGAPPESVMAAGALLQSLGQRAEKLRRRAIKTWRRIQRSGAIVDALEEIRGAGSHALLQASIAERAAGGLAQPGNGVHHDPAPTDSDDDAADADSSNHTTSETHL